MDQNPMQPAGAGGGQQATAHRGPGGGESQGQLGPNSDRVAAPALAPNQLNNMDGGQQCQTMPLVPMQPQLTWATNTMTGWHPGSQMPPVVPRHPWTTNQMPGAGHTAGGGAGGEIGQRQHAPSGVEQGQGQHGPIREAQQFAPNILNTGEAAAATTNTYQQHHRQPFGQPPWPPRFNPRTYGSAPAAYPALQHGRPPHRAAPTTSMQYRPTGASGPPAQFFPSAMWQHPAPATQYEAIGGSAPSHFVPPPPIMPQHGQPDTNNFPDGTHTLAYLQGAVPTFNEFIMVPITLRVVNIETPRTTNNGAVVCNIVLTNQANNRITMTAWEDQTQIVSELVPNTIYTFYDLKSLTPFGASDLWYRLGFGSRTRFMPQPSGIAPQNLFPPAGQHNYGGILQQQPQSDPGPQNQFQLAFGGAGQPQPSAPHTQNQFPLTGQQMFFGGIGQNNQTGAGTSNIQNQPPPGQHAFFAGGPPGAAGQPNQANGTTTGLATNEEPTNADIAQPSTPIRDHQA